MNMCVISSLMYMSGVQSVVGSNPTRGRSFLFRKFTTLGVLCCFVLCMTLLGSSFLLHLSLTCTSVPAPFACTTLSGILSLSK